MAYLTAELAKFDKANKMASMYELSIGNILAAGDSNEDEGEEEDENEKEEYGENTEIEEGKVQLSQYLFCYTTAPIATP